MAEIYTEQMREWLEDHDRQVKEEIIEKLFNTECFKAKTLNQLRELKTSNDYDKGWDDCFDLFSDVAEEVLG